MNLDERLQNLKADADREMADVIASPDLLARAVQAAEAPRRAGLSVPRLRFDWLKRAAIPLCAAAAVIAGVLILRPESPLPTPHTGKAGGETSVEVTAAPLTDIRIENGAASLEHTLFVGDADGSFPMFLLDGRCYRLLSAPCPVPAECVGDFSALITEFYVEPVLASGGNVSNALPVNEPVHAVNASAPGLMAAELNGEKRLWQRASCAGEARVGSETLTDTLCDPEAVVAVEWDGHGTVLGEDARALCRLLASARYEGADMRVGESLRLTLDNGLQLQLMLDGDRVSACGTWYCEGFGDKLREMVESK